MASPRSSDPAHGPGRRTWAEGVLLFAATFFAVTYPAGLAYRRYGSAAPFKFFANDSFYYLTVARRSAALPFFSYDAAHPTNGFHPMWEWVLSFSSTHLGLGGPSDRELLFDYALCAVLSGCGVAMLALVLSRLTGSRVLAFFALVPGFYDLVMSRLSFSITDSTESAPWSFVNGMETSLSVFWFGIFALLIFRHDVVEDASARLLLLLSCVLGGVVLTRLDDVFLVVAFVALLVVTSRGREEAVRRGVIASAVPAVGLAAYLAYNFKTTGLWLPVSGSMKRGIKLPENIASITQTLVPTLQWGGKYSYSWDIMNWRALQLVVPLAVAASYLLWVLLVGAGDSQTGPASSGTRRAGDTRRLVATLAVYVVLKGAYNLVMVPLYAQGHWYYPLCILTTNVIVALGAVRALRSVRMADFALLDKGLRRRVLLLVRGASVGAGVLGVLVLSRVLHHASGPGSSAAGGGQAMSLVVVAVGALACAAVLWTSAPRIVAALEARATRGESLPLAPACGVLAMVFAVLSANAAVNQKQEERYVDLSYAFWLARKDVDAFVSKIGATGRIFEFDDGIMGYALDAPTMNAMGLAIDAAAYRAFREGKWLDVAYERGFNVMSSVTYWSYLIEQRSGFVRPESDADVLKSLVGSDAGDGGGSGDDGRFHFELKGTLKIGRYALRFVEFRRSSSAENVIGTK
jgi:hypothetical protein